MSFQSQSMLMLSVCSVLFGCAAHTPAPVSGLKKDYSSIPRGSYRGSYYEVQRGDTLYFIAYVTDKDVKEIISYNNLIPPYTIYPGQKLRLWRPAYTPPSYGSKGTTAIAVVTPPTPIPPPVTSSKNSTQQVASKADQKPPELVKKDPPKEVEQRKPKEYVEAKAEQNVNKTVTTPKPKNNNISKWLWPTKGRVIKNFSAGDQGNKGIDIAGQRGQAIVSTAEGTVVYSGNALRGYGNLVIVKHNDNYLSAYAHNDQLLVREGQSVKAGQKIATMGSSGTNSVRLHFEIRYQGKSVNPKRYLP
ncbi:murein hydrolase activator NlpD [Vibrio japonicus]|uniref:Murein hydrolase activator NlpD n=1 Tax=Vibrio japonicus TaxID=1824638 RepID=A0ABY5LH08_9VIBR|nr:murein hydrolase activator NlpD [Vibrio japonicus]UUM30231.1 murein hydrolase activator NlpD [Vibrio japonicus]